MYVILLSEFNDCLKSELENAFSNFLDIMAMNIVVIGNLNINY